MATEEKIIVAIELGSSRVTGAAGIHMPDGSIQVKAWEQENSTSFINHGVIYNIPKAEQSLTSIVRKLEGRLNKKIRHVYVGFGGQGVHSRLNVISRDMEEGSQVTQELVDQIVDENKNMVYADRNTFDVVTQEFVVGKQRTNDPVGIIATHIEGHFLNLVTRTSAIANMSKCVNDAGVSAFDYLCSPRVLADCVLTDVDRRSGCVLVDLGLGTTTVAVYKGNILRHLSVIPIGMGNVTKDIASLQIELDEAEELKLKYGSAYTEFSEEDEAVSYNLRDGRQISKKEFCDIVEARIEEIVVNVYKQIECSGYTRATLLAGLVLTGGGSNMKNIDKAFKVHQSAFDKLRIARTVNFHVTSNLSSPLEENGRNNVVLGLLSYGTENCCSEKPKDGGLFGDEPDKDTEHVGTQPTTKVDEIAAIKHEEEEARRRAIELEEQNKKSQAAKLAAKAEEIARKKKEKEDKKRRRKERIDRMKKRWTNFLESLVTDDEDK